MSESSGVVVVDQLTLILPEYLNYIGGDERKLVWIKEQMILQLTKQYPKLVQRMTVPEYVKLMIDYYVFAAHLHVK